VQRPIQYGRDIRSQPQQALAKLIQSYEWRAYTDGTRVASTGNIARL
jgi:hypothetical protein